ncbi:MAG: SLC13 family permease [Pseudomonadota bacterium]|nr:SLC13 family permease [Pseudomonadota bacterium]
MVHPAYLICVPALLGVVLRPWGSKEELWASAGAAALVLTGSLPLRLAADAVARGGDVYCFLIGMMLLAATAQQVGLFEVAAGACVRLAQGSPRRLFALVYGMGAMVTVFLSNDATAVVLTPAVLAVTRQARVEPLPYLLACALVANAASFVLPVSNPANLVVFGNHLPALGAWLGRFALASLLSIAATYAVLRWRSRAALSGAMASPPPQKRLSSGGRCAAFGLAMTTVLLLGVSARGMALGVPTLSAAAAVWIAASHFERPARWTVLRQMSWSVVPLVAGLFVIVAGLQHAGLLDALTVGLQALMHRVPSAAAVLAGAASAVVTNLMNNLPAGLIAGMMVAGPGHDELMRSAVAIGIDLGPNLSVTGSLATILWLVAIRREGVDVSAWTFFKTGLLAMPMALLAALAGLWLQSV